MFKSPFGKYKPTKIKKPSQVKIGTAASGTVGPSQAAGGQGHVQVEQPPMGPDTSYQDSIYNQGQSNIQTGLNNLGGYLLGQGQSLGLDYGVDTSGADPTKYDPAHPPAFKVDWEHVDVTNPFSRAALLKRAHTQNVAGNNNSMAARGQLYSGALQNAQNAEDFNYQGGQDALTKDFGQKWGGLYGQWLAAKQAGDQQGLDNLSAAILRHQDDPAVGKGFNTGGAAAPGTNPNQYADSSPGGRQPPEQTSQAVKDYLKKQKNAKVKHPRHPRHGNTGGARAPGG